MPTLAELAQMSDGGDSGAYVGYPQLQRQTARMRQAQIGRTVENLPDPRTYGFMSGLLGTPPDQLGMSVLSPNTAPAKDAAYYGYQLSNLGQMLPAIAPATKAFLRTAGNAVNDAMVYGTGPLARITPQPMRMADVSEYGMSHRPMTVQQGASPLHDLSNAFDDTIYSKNALQNYGTGSPRLDREALKVFSQVKGNPDAQVTIYRAVPKRTKESKINSGDWVTVSKEYAMEHGDAALEGKYKILSQKVPAKHITTNADSILEQGYYPND